MEKYRVDRMNIALAYADAFPPMENHRDVYLASEVEARITALEGALGCSACPYPIGDDISVQKCIRAGKCGCGNKSLMEK